MGLTMEHGGTVEGYEAVPLGMGEAAASARGGGGAVLRRRSARPSRRAVLYVHGIGDSFVPDDLVCWYTERGFHFYAADLRDIGTASRASEDTKPWADLGECFSCLDAADAHLRQADGIGTVVVCAHGSGALIAALWCHSRRARRPADALVLAAPHLATRPAFLGGGAALFGGSSSSTAGLGKSSTLGPGSGVRLGPSPSPSPSPSPGPGLSAAPGPDPKAAPSSGAATDVSDVSDSESGLGVSRGAGTGSGTTGVSTVRVPAPRRPLAARRPPSLMVAAAQRRVRKGLAITCPVLVMCPESGWDAPGGTGGLLPRIFAGGRVTTRLGEHVTWLKTGAVHSPDPLPEGPQRKEFFDEIGRWLGAYLSGQVRDQLL